MFRFDFKILLAVVASAFAFIVSTSGLHAATCPDNAALAKTITLTPATGCWAYGIGNIPGDNNDPIIATTTVGGNTFVQGGGYVALPGLTFLDKYNYTGSQSTSGPLNGVITTVSSGEVGATVQGSFMIGNTTGWSSLILGIKAGNNSDPTWAAFTINGPETYSFTIDPKQGSGLSHLVLYGVASVVTTSIPVPAAGFLLIGGLGGLAALRRRRKKAT